MFGCYSGLVWQQLCVVLSLHMGCVPLSRIVSNFLSSKVAILDGDFQQKEVFVIFFVQRIFITWSGWASRRNWLQENGGVNWYVKHTATRGVWDFSPRTADCLLRYWWDHWWVSSKVALRLSNVSEDMSLHHETGFVISVHFLSGWLLHWLIDWLIDWLTCLPSFFRRSPWKLLPRQTSPRCLARNARTTIAARKTLGSIRAARTPTKRAGALTVYTGRKWSGWDWPPVMWSLPCSFPCRETIRSWPCPDGFRVCWEFCIRKLFTKEKPGWMVRLSCFSKPSDCLMLSADWLIDCSVDWSIDRSLDWLIEWFGRFARSIFTPTSSQSMYGFCISSTFFVRY